MVLSDGRFKITLEVCGEFDFEFEIEGSIKAISHDLAVVFSLI